MPLSFLLKGLVIGFSIAAPVGPIGILCIQRTMAKGRIAGLATGMGAASADAIYGCIAGFGLSFISQFLVAQQMWLKLGGGLFLGYLGLRTILSKPEEKTIEAGSAGLLSDYLTTFFLTLTNPMTILSFTAVFAGLGLATGAGNYTAAITLVAGVFLGSAGWWLLLTSGVGLFWSKPGPTFRTWINRISGAVLMVFAVVALVSMIW